MQKRARLPGAAVDDIEDIFGAWVNLKISRYYLEMTPLLGCW
jgi:hypothetical protein